MKRVLTFLITFILTVSMFAGCGGKKTSSGNSPANNNGFVITADDVKYIAQDGSSVYRIVRPEGNTIVTPFAGTLFKEMKDGLGIAIKNVSDTEEGTDVYEILVGNTNRPESKAAIDYLYDNKMGRYQDFIICTMGKKIVINAITDEAVESAVKYFIQNFIKKDGVTGGIKYTYATPGEFGTVTINGVDISKFSVLRDKSNRSWLVQEEYRKVQEKIREKTGYFLPLTEDKDATEKEYEIHIGNTIRTAKPQSNYNYDTWEISIADKKVYLAGGSTYAVQVALTEFGKMLEKGVVTSANSKTGSYADTTSGYDSSTYYRLVWGDEFDGNDLDESKWIIRDSFNEGSVGPVNLVKNDQTFEVTGGNLIFRAIRNDQGGFDHCDAIKSEKSTLFNMGYLEMRARIPDGQGVYTSFWAVGKDGQRGTLEIDIFESLGSARHLQRANIIKWLPEEDGGRISLDDLTNRDYIHKDGTLFDDYRTVSLLWTDTELRFFYDGYEYFSHPAEDFYKEKFLYIIAGFNVGWKDRTVPDESLQFPLEYHIDYIRLYQIDGQSVMFE